MKSKGVLLIIGLSLIYGMSGCGDNSQQEAFANFIFEVEPVLEDKCRACHGNDPTNIEGGLDLTSRKGVLRGGQSGRAILDIDHPEKSALIAAIKRVDPDLAMPPKSNERLSPKEIAHFETWIRDNAPWPTEEERQRVKNNTAYKGREKIPLPIHDALTESWQNRTYRMDDLWAFVPISFSKAGETSHPVDFFIEQKLKEVDLEVSQVADDTTLIRRLFWTMLGLPPSLEDIARWTPIDEKYEVLVDSLLQHPAYGEQMSRHWLDVVRYADTDGFSNDFSRPNAWRYRDYVIRSFNQDKPYDQFIKEQIAGDEMDGTNPEYAIATGFLRMGPWEHTGMSVAKETRQYFLDDVVNSVGETFMSLPLKCAQCHDHKFDPIPSIDYYRIQSIFATTQFADRVAPFMQEENTSHMDSEKLRIEKWIRETKKEEERMRKKEEAAAKKWYKSNHRKYLSKRERRKLPDNEQPPRYVGLTYADLGYRKVLQKRMQNLRIAHRRFEGLAYSVYNGPDRADREVRSGNKFSIPASLEGALAKTHLLTGGSIYSPANEVAPGVLQSVQILWNLQGDSVLTSLGKEMPVLKDRRLAFAEWLTDPRHPLVARSIANRVWQWCFGKGLVDDANNFGLSSTPPTHRKLLDYLAGYLIRNDWSIKKLGRLILTSGTFKRKAKPANKSRQDLTDPDNHFYAHFTPRRLHAEEIRDGILKISGALNAEMGGIPIRPEINGEVALQPRHTMGSIAQAYQPSKTPDERNRRTIYAERIRSLENPFLSVFDQPRTEISCSRRSSATITPQVYALFNSDQFRTLSLYWALKYQTESNVHAIANQMMGDIWLRDPTAEEVVDAQKYISEMVQYHQQNETPKKLRPQFVTRKMFEEMTGEPFEYQERLDVFENYVEDPQYADVSPDFRALADFGNVLINSNEFIYIY